MESDWIILSRFCVRVRWANRKFQYNIAAHTHTHMQREGKRERLRLSPAWGGSEACQENFVEMMN